MALHGLKKSEQSDSEAIDEFIHGATKRVQQIEPPRHTYRRFTFSLNEEVSADIDALLVSCRIAKANRSIVLKAAVQQLKKMNYRELQNAILKELK